MLAKRKLTTIYNLPINNDHRDILKLDIIPSDEHFVQKDHRLTLVQSLQLLNSSKTST